MIKIVFFFNFFQIYSKTSRVIKRAKYDSIQKIEKMFFCSYDIYFCTSDYDSMTLLCIGRSFCIIHLIIFYSYVHTKSDFGQSSEFLLR